MVEDTMATTLSNNNLLYITSLTFFDDWIHCTNFYNGLKELLFLKTLKFFGCTFEGQPEWFLRTAIKHLTELTMTNCDHPTYLSPIQSVDNVAVFQIKKQQIYEPTRCLLNQLIKSPTLQKLNLSHARKLTSAAIRKLIAKMALRYEDISVKITDRKVRIELKEWKHNVDTKQIKGCMHTTFSVNSCTVTLVEKLLEGWYHI